MKKAVIVGCGWLGQQLGVHLKEHDYHVLGTCRSDETMRQLKERNIEPIRLELTDTTAIPKELEENTDVLIMAFPPQKREQPDYYGCVLVNIARQFPESTRIIFTSSTGIYPKGSGTYDESYEFQEKEQNSSLYQAEQALRGYFNDRLNILRLGGLIGPKRHPAYTLSGRTFPNDGQGKINLIHSGDICVAVRTLLEQNINGRTYNVVFGTHPAKKTYYLEAANSLGLNPPVFGSAEGPNRVIDGRRIEEELPFRYSFKIHNFSQFER